MGDAFDAFCERVLFGSVEEVHAHLRADPGLVAQKDDYGFTPLHLLMTEERAEVVALLIEAGADVLARNDDGNTPLHLAQDPEAVPLLIAAGADVNLRNAQQQTPLIAQAYESSETGAFEVMQKLLELGADPGARDAHGQTALDIAKVGGDPDILALLDASTHAR